MNLEMKIETFCDEDILSGCEFISLKFWVE